ncbi:hypothetical protein Tco_1160858, partial [Tanacetum coccineum]
MSITKEQQQALDNALVPREQRLRIGNCNYRLSTTFKPKEPTFQIALDVDTLHQPWRTFGTIINKCLSGKVTGLDQLRLSRAQIIWGMYYNKNVDYVHLLWEDLFYQIDNKVLKKNKDMYYPRFTKVIINHFMSKDQSIPRRNKVDWHMAKDDPILTIMRFIPKHKTVQKYDAILPDTVTNQAMKESDAYKTYYDLATGKMILKPKYVRRSTREKTEQAPKASPGKRLKATAKVTKSGKKKLPAQGLETLSEIALSEAEQMKIVTKRSKLDLHSSHAGGSGANEGTGVSPGVPDDDDDEVSISKDNDDNADNEGDDGQDDDNEHTESDNDGDDFIHPKFSTHDEEERQDEEDKEEEGSDLRVQTPSHFESTDDEVTQGDNVKGEELDEEETNEEEEVNELYRDVNINPKRRDTEMTNASQTNVQGFISNMLNPNPDTCIDSILNQNTESTSLVDVIVTTNAEMPHSSITTLPPPPIPL